MNAAPLTAYGAIIEGFKADCAKLLKSFVDSGRYDFNTFVDIWQDMKFSLVFCNCTLPELKLYSIHIFLVLKSYLTADNFGTLGPFYLLYALYYKQPTKSALIRMTKEEMESLMRLTDKYADKGYYLPAYMLAKLQSEKAFYYTADSQLFAMDYHFEKKFKFSGTCDFKNGVDKQTDFIKNAVIKSGWYDQWKVVEDKYNNIKSQILKGEEKRKTEPNISMSHVLAPTDLLKEFKINDTAIVSNKGIEEQSDKSESTSGSIGKSRVNLKRKTFQAPVIFNKYEKKDEPTHEENVKPNEASNTPVDNRNNKKGNVGQWKHFLKDCINQGKQH